MLKKNEPKQTENFGNGIGEKNSCFGTCWIFNDDLKETKRIKKDAIDQFVANGWQLGMRKKYFKGKWRTDDHDNTQELTIMSAE
jgi:hypothetical protein